MTIDAPLALVCSWTGWPLVIDEEGHLAVELTDGRLLDMGGAYVPRGEYAVAAVSTAAVVRSASDSDLAAARKLLDTIAWTSALAYAEGWYVPLLEYQVVSRLTRGTRKAPES